MSRYIAMYLAIPHPPDHLETPGTKSKFNENPPPRCGLLSRFFRLCLCRHLGCVRLAFFVVVLSISWTHHRTVSPANINLVPSRLGLLPERMCMFLFHFFSFFLFFSFFPCLFSFLIPGLIPGTPYSSCEVPDILLLLT